MRCALPWAASVVGPAGCDRVRTLVRCACIAFGSASLWLRWKDDNGLLGFLRSQENEMLEKGTGQFRPEEYTLPDLPAVDLENVKLLNRLNL